MKQTVKELKGETGNNTTVGHHRTSLLVKTEQNSTETVDLNTADQLKVTNIQNIPPSNSRIDIFLK